MKSLMFFGVGILIGLYQKVDISGLIYKDSTQLVELPKINLYEMQYQKSLEISSTMVRLQQLQVEIEDISKKLENIKAGVQVLENHF